MQAKSTVIVQTNDDSNCDDITHFSIRNLLVILIMMLAVFPPLSETIYTPSLPNLALSLKTSGQLVEWTVSFYFVGYALGIGAWGGVADLIGRKKAALFGIGIYLIGCLCCLSVTNISWLFFGRFILALGASVGSVITQTIIRDTFSGSERR